jgi:hypothetical protein
MAETTCFKNIEKSPGYESRRLFLSKVRDKQDSELLQRSRRRQYVDDTDLIYISGVFHCG